MVAPSRWISYYYYYFFLSNIIKSPPVTSLGLTNLGLLSALLGVPVQLEKFCLQLMTQNDHLT